MTIVAIYIAPMKGATQRAVEVVEALAGQGLEGDRNCRPERSPGAQLTLIEREHIDAFGKATGFPMRLDQSRRNVVTEGVRLNDLVGRRFRVGGALVEGIELCEPCKLFQQRVHPEVIRFFVGKGGLRARIVADGVLRPGDAITAEDGSPL